MSLYKDIQDRIRECMRESNVLERDTLRTVLGEAQNKSTSNIPTDVEVLAILKKSKESAVETMSVADKTRWGTIPLEVKIYEKFLPSYISLEKIVETITMDSAILEMVKSAKSDGQATGIAVGFFKKNNMPVEGQDVSKAVKTVRLRKVELV